MSGFDFSCRLSLIIVKIASLGRNADSSVLGHEIVTMLLEFHHSGLQVPCAISLV